MSQLRGLGQARPLLAASFGTATASGGRTLTKPATQLRAIGTDCSQPAGSSGMAGVPQPLVNPSAIRRASLGQSR